MSVDSPDWVRQIISESEVSGAVNSDIYKVSAMKELLLLSESLEIPTPPWSEMWSSTPEAGEVWHVALGEAYYSSSQTGAITILIVDKVPGTTACIMLAWAVQTADYETARFDTPFVLFPGQKLILMCEHDSGTYINLDLQGYKQRI